LSRRIADLIKVFQEKLVFFMQYFIDSIPISIAHDFIRFCGTKQMNPLPINENFISMLTYVCFSEEKSHRNERTFPVLLLDLS